MVADTVETRQPQMLTEALILVDDGLSRLQSRELVSANEVADLLLDLRTLLTRAADPVSGELEDLDDVPVVTN
jgi:hypothetical protein